MVTRRASRLFLLAALLWLGFIPSAFALRSPGASATVLPENRVRGADAIPSGRLSVDDAQSPENTMGLTGFAYETASGRFLWLNRDPKQESGGINLYEALGNCGIDYVDTDGRGLPQSTQNAAALAYDAAKNNAKKLILICGAFTGAKAAANLYYSWKTAWDNSQSYQDEATLLNNKFGDQGNWPPFALDTMQNWNVQTINQTGNATSQTGQTLPGQFGKGPVSNPFR